MNWMGDSGGSGHRKLPPFKVAKKVTLQAKKEAVGRRLAKRRKK